MDIAPINSSNHVVTYTAEPLEGKRISVSGTVSNVYIESWDPDGDGPLEPIEVTFAEISTVNGPITLVVPNGMPIPVLGSVVNLKYVLVEDVPTLFQYKTQ